MRRSGDAARTFAHIPVTTLTVPLRAKGNVRAGKTMRRCDVFEDVLGPEASYLRRLGVLCAALCGACSLLGVVLLVLQPCAANCVATACALVMALVGAELARRS